MKRWKLLSDRSCIQLAPRKQQEGDQGSMQFVTVLFFRVFRNMSAYPNTLDILALNLITVEI